MLFRSDFNKRPIIWIEHKDGSLVESKNTFLTEKYHKIILTKLLKVNPDFKDAYEDNSQAANPIIRICPRGTGPFSEDKGKIKRSYIVK